MFQLRTRLISVLDTFKVLDAAMLARKYVRMPYLPILTYHRVGDPARDAAELDEGVVDATREQFARQVELMSKNFELCGADDLIQHFNGEKRLPKNPALITFDDGYRACHDIALPILQRYGAKAIFFISTDHMTHRKAFWWDRVNYLVKRSTKTRVEMEYPSHVVYDLSGDRSAQVQRMLDVIKETFALDVERYLQELSKALDVPWTPEVEKRITDDVLGTWDQVRAMRKAGMDIGSHTRTHRVLPTLPAAELKEELEGSKKALEEQLDEKVPSIAYPVSLSMQKHRAIFEAVKAAGYELGFSTSGGVGPLGSDTNPLDIQRIWVDPNLPFSYFRAAVAMPHLTYRAR